MADAPPGYSDLFPDKGAEASAPLNPGAPSVPLPPGAPAPYPTGPYGAGQPGSAPPPDQYPPPGAGYQSHPGYAPSQPAGQPYPPQQGQPYPPQGQPYPPQQGQPYPPQGQPYPPQGQPYPPQGQPYANPAQQAGQFNLAPGQPGNYTHAAVTVTGPPNNAGFQTTPLAYGTTSQIGRSSNAFAKICLIFCSVFITMAVIMGVLSSVFSS